MDTLFIPDDKLPLVCNVRTQQISLCIDEIGKTEIKKKVKYLAPYWYHYLDLWLC